MQKKLNLKEEKGMPLLQIKKQFQITIPAKFREILELKEGDIIEAELKNNTIILKPKIVLDKKVSQLQDK